MKDLAITERIDNWAVPPFRVRDLRNCPELANHICCLVEEIELAVKSLRSGHGPGPYGTLETILTAVDDFIETSTK